MISQKVLQKLLIVGAQIYNSIARDHVDNIKQCMYRERKQHIPLHPKNVFKGIRAMKNREVKIIEGESFLLLNDATNNI